MGSTQIRRTFMETIRTISSPYKETEMAITTNKNKTSSSRPDGTKTLFQDSFDDHCWIFDHLAIDGKEFRQAYI